MLQINQNRQLEYTHCRIIKMKELLNEQIKKKINKYSEIKIMKELLLFQELIYMSSATRKKVIQQHYDNVLTEHFEIDKTIELIS